MSGPLAHPAYRAWLAARTVNALGNAAAPIALAFAVLDLTGSLVSLGLVVAARSLANALLVLVGGVVADRLRRDRVLVGSNVVAAASQAAVATLVLTGTAHIPLLAALSAVNGAAAAFAFPASTALLPQTVPVALRQQATALGRLSFNAALIGGASLGGVMVVAVGPGWGIALDAMSFAVAAILFRQVRVPAARVAGVGGNALLELREGWGEFTARSWLWAIVAAFLFINAAAVGGFTVLGPAVADQTIGRTAWGLVLAVQTGGLVVGGLVALRLRPARPLLVGMLCTTALALPLVALAISPTVPVLLVVAALGGLAIEQFGVAWDVALQNHIPPERLARVSSYDALGSFIAIPVGEAAVGPIAHSVGLTPTLLGCAAIVLVASLAALADPGVRRLRRGPVPQTLPVEPRLVESAPVKYAEPGRPRNRPGPSGRTR